MPLTFANESRTLRITTGESAPYTSQSVDGQGVTAKIIREALRRAGYKLELRFYPWKRAWSEAIADDDIDGTAYWFPADWRREHFLYSAPLISERYVFFHLKSQPLPAWERLADLSELRLGATHAYTYSDEFRQLAANGTLQVEWVYSDEINFRKLLHGRLHAFPFDVLGGYYLLHKRFSPEEASRVAHHGRPLFRSDQHLLLKRSAPESRVILEQFNAALAQMREEGEIDRYFVNMMLGKYARQKED